MKKLLLTSAAMLMLASGAWAADDTAKTAPASAPAATAPKWQHHPMTLEEARKRAHKNADKLDKMTEEEWAAQQKKRHENREKWLHMTPEEREAYKKERFAKRHHQEQSSTAPAAPASEPTGGKP